MTTEAFVNLSAGSFRTLTWGTGAETVLFLHGLTGVSEVWGPTVSHLPPGRRYVALDQRGHGQSARGTALDYSAGAFVRDTREVINLLGGKVHLVGHSMGARIALIMAARFPGQLVSSTVVDIGPEASRKNIADTVAGLSRRPESFADRDAALAFGFRSRVPTAADEAVYMARLQRHADGSYTWLSPRDALNACVTRQRSRNYWKEWRQIRGPAMFVHGGASAEVSTGIAHRMRQSNPSVRFERLTDVGHDVPLIAPQTLAGLLDGFWQSVGLAET